MKNSYKTIVLYLFGLLFTPTSSCSGGCNNSHRKNIKAKQIQNNDTGSTHQNDGEKHLNDKKENPENKLEEIEQALDKEKKDKEEKEKQYNEIKEALEKKIKEREAASKKGNQEEVKKLTKACEDAEAKLASLSKLSKEQNKKIGELEKE